MYWIDNFKACNCAVLYCRSNLILSIMSKWKNIRKKDNVVSIMRGLTFLKFIFTFLFFCKLFIPKMTENAERAHARARLICACGYNFFFSIKAHSLNLRTVWCKRMRNKFHVRTCNFFARVCTCKKKLFSHYYSFVNCLGYI